MESYTVVGGGLAGLTAANALADRGYRVTLLEQTEHLGGLAATRQNRGYALNFGPHALYRGGTAHRQFRDWKIPFVGHPPVQGSAAFLVREGRKYPFIQGGADLLRSRMFTWQERLDAIRMLIRLRAGHAPAEQSVEEWLAANVSSERVRDFGRAIFRISTFVADLAPLSASAGISQVALAVSQGVVYLDGGWQTLVDGLAQRAQSRGVSIRCGEHVTDLQSIQGDGVILAVPPAAVTQITGRPLPALQPVRVALLDLGLRKWPTGGATFGLGVDRPLYFSVHSAAAKLAPEGAALVHVAKYLIGEQSDAHADRMELELFADFLMPGWRDQAEVVRFLPNLAVMQGTYPRGGRPDVDALGLDGVAIAGDWVGPEGMLTDAVVASAFRAVNVVQRRKTQAA